ncbi:MAG: sodium-dependent transporter [Parvibaculales bacterium]
MQKTSTSFWTSNIGFIMACIGAAVGLGNIWKFPYMTGTQGGGAFVLIYLASIFAIATPIAAAELLIGRSGQSDAVSSVRKLARDNQRGEWLGWVGGIAVLGAFTLLTFYAVIAGWVSAYIISAASGGLSSLDSQSSGAHFSALLAEPGKMIAHQILFLLLLGLILVRKLSSGLERANLVLMPSLIFMLIAIAIYGAIIGDLSAALGFLFTPDFSKITPQVIQSAIGHGFFSVGVGAAMLITYGAYVDKKIDLGKTAILIALADTVIALLAGIGIFSIVFGQSLDAAAGPGLIFTTLPLAFAQIPAGGWVALVFFFLVYFAALTSGLSLAEVIIRWAENRFSWSRPRATIIMMGLTFVVGLATVFSFNIWQDVRLSDVGHLADKTLFDVKDYLVTAYIMPLGGLGAIMFAGWALPQAAAREALGSRELLFKLWLGASRFVAPIGIIWIIIANL